MEPLNLEAPRSYLSERLSLCLDIKLRYEILNVNIFLVNGCYSTTVPNISVVSFDLLFFGIYWQMFCGYLDIFFSRYVDSVLY